MSLHPLGAAEHKTIHAGSVCTIYGLFLLSLYVLDVPIAVSLPTAKLATECHWFVI